MKNDFLLNKFFACEATTWLTCQTLRWAHIKIFKIPDASTFLSILKNIVNPNKTICFSIKFMFVIDSFNCLIGKIKRITYPSNNNLKN